MSYQGTAGDDHIDQRQLQLADWSQIFAGVGNDTILIGKAAAAGQQGNDHITGLDPSAQAGYWDSPAGIDADLSTGRVSDGFGTIDTLVNVHQLAGSRFGDKVTGSSQANKLWESSGNDLYDGGAGEDVVIYYNMAKTDVRLSYDSSTKVLTVEKLSGPLSGVDRLVNVESLSFTQSDGSTQNVQVQDFTGPFTQTTFLPIPRPSSTAVLEQIVPGDFNGDGLVDLWMNQLDGGSTGRESTKVQILAGDGNGGFTDITASLWRGVVPSIYYAPRVAQADFNSDGISDLFVPDFGMDKPPFPGGQSRLFLSGADGMRDASAGLLQRLTQAHGVSVGDVTGDGRPEVLYNQLNDQQGWANVFVSLDASGTVSNHFNWLPASIQKNGTYAPGHTWSYLGDLNADGRNDVVLGTWDANSQPSWVLLNTGQEAPFASSVPVALPRSGVDKEIILASKPLDLNGDDLPDLVLSVTNGGDHGTFYKLPYLQFLVNKGQGVFVDETSTRLPQDPTGRPGGWIKFIDVVDFNGDGHMDLLVTATGSKFDGVGYLNDGQGRYAEFRRFSDYVAVKAVDLNGDGAPEVVGGTSGELKIWWNDMYIGPRGRHVNTLADDTFWGGAGLDTTVFANEMSRYKLDWVVPGVLRVTDSKGWAGSDTLHGMERLSFANTSLALDLNGQAGQGARILGAVFGASAVSNPHYVGVVLNLLDGGMTSETLMQLALQVKLGTEPNHADVVNLLYTNLAGTAPSQADRAQLTGLLDSGAYNPTSLGMLAADSAINGANIDLVGLAQTGLAYLPA